MTTRREIVKAVAGFSGILAAGEAPASVVKSLIGMRNAMMAAKRLPYDSEVEYLESTGMQWIDTGVIPNAYSTMSCGIQFTDGENIQLFGKSLNTGETNSRFAWGLNTQKSRYFGVGSLNYTYDYKDITAYADRNIDLVERTVSINDVSVRLNFSIGVFSSTVWLFKRNYQGGDFPCKCRLYYFRMSGSSEVDLIPVRFTNEQGQTEGAMYDRVSGQLFRNAGTGDFVVGPDK